MPPYCAPLSGKQKRYFTHFAAPPSKSYRFAENFPDDLRGAL
jgi:hypothetical protein